ncbi:hypothetical protein [Corynebacterium sp. LK2510]|uniref:hypothetical protein n=1 Tax=Corynebacterium sp. LK2510 TaxID=3110472 RepID=UPI0034CDA885
MTGTMQPRKRRRARREAEVDYDRFADTPVTRGRVGDGARRVILDDDEAPPLDDLEYLENEKPPHYGGE